MKKSTMAVLTFATMLAMVACAKKVQKSPLEKADPKVASPADTDASNAFAAGDKIPAVGKSVQQTLPEGASEPADSNVSALRSAFAVSGSFQGAMVTIAMPHKEKRGSIRIIDEDAKALYNALRIKTTVTEKTETYLAGTAKSGQGIRCYKSAEVKTPTAEEFTCDIFFNYALGSVSSLAFRFESDNSVPAFTEKYIGKNVVLDPTSPVPTAIVRVVGLDAQAIYKTLSTEAKPNAEADFLDVTAMEKQGKNISCVKSRPSTEKEDVYKCTLRFEAATGIFAELEPLAN